MIGGGDEDGIEADAEKKTPLVFKEPYIHALQQLVILELQSACHFGGLLRNLGKPRKWRALHPNGTEI